MDNMIIAALITGITTGGLSCMLVQGGLLTTTLANRLEVELQGPLAQAPKKKKQAAVQPRKPELALPIFWFLLAKLAAYTLLGFLLGALGSVLSLTAVMRGVLQAAIGVFMVGNALRMLNVHPIFRYFNFEPPSSVTRYIRRQSKNATAVTPLMLGALTVLIPCGVTQSMMALAVGTGSPLQGAAILFAFTLGASPVFFGLTYLVTRLGALLEKNFNRVAAVVLIVLGVWTFDTGLALMGSPVTLSRLAQNVAGAVAGQEPLQTFDPGGSAGISPFTEQEAAQPASDVLEIVAGDFGYTPNRLRAPANTTVTLNLITQGTYSCSRAFVIPALDVTALLPAEGTETLEIPPQKAGTKLRFACSMGMYTGEITFQ